MVAFARDAMHGDGDDEPSVLRRLERLERLAKLHTVLLSVATASGLIRLFGLETLLGISP